MSRRRCDFCVRCKYGRTRVVAVVVGVSLAIVDSMVVVGVEPGFGRGTEWNWVPNF